MEVVIVTGMSGAGKSQAIECLEDQGYYCIDNMPPALIKNFISLAATENSSIDKAAFVVDVRGGEIFGNLKEALDTLKASEEITYKVIFLEASDRALVQRFNETRRVHPTTKQTATVEAIKNEREALQGIRDISDFIIDTSNMKTAKLKKDLIEILNEEDAEETFVINIMSFGFKHGIPITADMVFDMRFIPNPYYVPSLKRSTGNSKKVRAYVMKHMVSKTFVKNLNRLINNIIPCYMKEGKFNLNIAFGCTGGQHRSVAMANEMAELFTLQGKQVTLTHRDIKK
ncbi:MAG: RNase adapter RapZ [Eubacteriaceae bacterium]|nr:RNase adapter RapZ [Eubacteriaceae bacterium]